MNALDEIDRNVQLAVDSLLPTLVSANHWPDCTFITLPLIYPGGSNVSVQVSASGTGFRVSDYGFGWQEADALGVEYKTFAEAVDTVVGQYQLDNSKHTIYTHVDADGLYGAICAVSTASWKIAEKMAFEADQENEKEDLQLAFSARLISIFGRDVVHVREKLTGASTNPWPFTAVVHRGTKISAFQALPGSTYSIYRTSSAFGDIADLEKPPTLIAVVPSKAALGVKLGLLSRNGRVIEHHQSDDVIERAAA